MRTSTEDIATDPLAAGIQELEISAMAPPPHPQDVTVDFDWAR